MTFDWMSRERFADDEAVTALQEARQLVEASALLGGLPGGGGLDELVDADDGGPVAGVKGNERDASCKVNVRNQRLAILEYARANDTATAKKDVR